MSRCVHYLAVLSCELLTAFTCTEEDGEDQEEEEEEEEDTRAESYGLEQRRNREQLLEKYHVS